MRFLGWHASRHALVLGVALVLTLFAGAANAQATRTWVSGVGDDANPCSRTAPCKTFAGAISKTAAGGEIDVLDPGGFGAVTITKSITIDGSGGSTAGVLVSGSNGVTINDNGAGAIVVTLRNLDFEGLGVGSGSTGIRGINFISGAELHVQRSVIRNFRDASNGTGISFIPTTAAKLFVTDTVLSGNGNGTVGGGIVIRPTGAGATLATLARVSIEHNILGVIADSTAGSGGVTLSIADSEVAGSDFAGIAAKGGATGTAAAKVMVNQTRVIGNNVGLNINGVTATLRIGNSVVTGNNTGVKIVGGTATSYGTNQIDDNAAPGSALPVMGPT